MNTTLYSNSTASNFSFELMNTTIKSAITSSRSGYTISRYSDGIRYTYVTLLLIILVTIIVGNITLIIVILFCKKLHTTTNVFIVNLALSDTLLAFTVIPFDIDKLLRGYFAFDETICELSSTVFFLSLPASTVNISILTFERFCAMRFPLIHRTGRLFTKRRNIAIIACSWLYTTITACLPVMGWRSFPTMVIKGHCFFSFEIEYAIFQVAVNFIAPLCFIIVMNIWILHIARHGLASSTVPRKNSSSGMRSTSQKNSRGTSGSRRKLLLSMKGKSISRQSSSGTQEANGKAAKVIAILVGAFFSCWTPYIVNVTVNITCRTCFSSKVTTATIILVFLNSAINPVLYGIYKPQIRSALKEAFDKLHRRISGRRGYRSHPIDKELEITSL